jgi:hypothetical protein
LSLLLLYLLQLALDWVAAFSLSLGTALCLFPAAGIGGYPAVPSPFTYVQILAKFAAFPITIGTLWACGWLAREDGDLNRGGRHLVLHGESLGPCTIHVQNAISRYQVLCYQRSARCI